MEETYRQWGRNIAQMRRLAGLSQRALAKELHVSQQSLSKWERGEAAPRDRHRIALARLFRVEVGTLFPLLAGAAA